MNKRAYFIAGIIVVIIIILLASNQNKVETGPIRIGLSLPLTGNLAFLGEADKNAALIAMEEISADKNLKNKYELVIEDDSFDAKKGASTVTKLISVDKVAAIISFGSTVGNVAAPIAEASKIPHIGMASDANVAKGEYNFINWTRPQEEVTLMLAEMQKRGINKVVILSVNQQGWKAIVDDFKARSAAAGIEVLGEEVFNSGQTDFKTTITKLAKLKPQMYLIGAFDPEIGIIAKQLKDMGNKIPLTSVETFGLTSDPKPLEGMWYIDAAEPTSNFAISYEKKYSKPVGPAAPNTYDAIHIIVNAIEAASKSGVPTSEQILAELTKTSNYNGALGNLSVNADRAFISQASVKVIKDGKVQLLK